MARHTTDEGVLLGRALRTRFVAALAALLLSGAAGWSQQYTISTVAGGVPPPTPAVALNSSVGTAQGVAADAAGNIYFTSIHCVFRVDGTGTLTRIAGTGRPGFSGDGGPAVSAQLNLDTGSASGLAVDSSGNIYVADTYNDRVRKISQSGVITTFAGGGVYGSSENGVPATHAFVQPSSVALDAAGNVYIADYSGIRRVDTTGMLTPIAGGGSVYPPVDGSAATSAELVFFTGIAVDSSGNILISTQGR